MLDTEVTAPNKPDAAGTLSPTVPDVRNTNFLLRLCCVLGIVQKTKLIRDIPNPPNGFNLIG